MARRGGFGIAATLSLGFFVLYWACLIGGEKLADRDIVSPFVGMWSANILIGLMGDLSDRPHRARDRRHRLEFLQRLVPAPLAHAGCTTKNRNRDSPHETHRPLYHPAVPRPPPSSRSSRCSSSSSSSTRWRSWTTSSTGRPDGASSLVLRLFRSGDHQADHPGRDAAREPVRHRPALDAERADRHEVQRHQPLPHHGPLRRRRAPGQRSSPSTSTAGSSRLANQKKFTIERVYLHKDVVSASGANIYVQDSRHAHPLDRILRRQRETSRRASAFRISTRDDPTVMVERVDAVEHGVGFHGARVDAQQRHAALVQRAARSGWNSSLAQPPGRLHFNPDDLRKKQEKPDEMDYYTLKQFIREPAAGGTGCGAVAGGFLQQDLVSVRHGHRRAVRRSVLVGEAAGRRRACSWASAC